MCSLLSIVFFSAHVKEPYSRTPSTSTFDIQILRLNGAAKGDDRSHNTWPRLLYFHHGNRVRLLSSEALSIRWMFLDARTSMFNHAAALLLCYPVCPLFGAVPMNMISVVSSTASLNTFHARTMAAITLARFTCDVDMMPSLPLKCYSSLRVTGSRLFKLTVPPSPLKRWPSATVLPLCPFLFFLPPSFYV